MLAEIGMFLSFTLKTQCPIVVEATLADCSMRPVHRMKTLVVWTLVVCVVVHSGDCCWIEVRSLSLHFIATVLISSMCLGEELLIWKIKTKMFRKTGIDVNVSHSQSNNYSTFQFTRSNTEVTGRQKPPENTVLSCHRLGPLHYRHTAVCVCVCITSWMATWNVATRPGNTFACIVAVAFQVQGVQDTCCLLYTSPSPRD